MKACTIANALLGTTIFLSSGLLFGQDPTIPTQSTQTSPSHPQTSTTPMQDSAGNSGDVGQIMTDKIFLRKAAGGGIAEVQLGHLAAEKASSDDVKQFGQKMVDDHTQLNDQLAPIADSLGVRLPKTMDKEAQAEYDKLNGLSGNDFDMEYLSFMMKDHHHDLREFRNEAASTQDAALRDAVNKGEKIIHEHMVMVDKLARAKGVPMPVHDHPPSPPPG